MMALILRLASKVMRSTFYVLVPFFLILMFPIWGAFFWQK
jgi:hypothetical protein